MKKTFVFLFLFFLLLTTAAQADIFSDFGVTVEEIDGSPSANVYKLKVSNSTLTDNSDGTATLAIGTGGSDPVLIDGVAVSDASGVDLQGGAGIDITFSSVASPDTASFIADLTELNTATFGSGTFTTLTFDAGVTDPVLTFGSNSLAITNAATFTNGGNAISDAATAFGGDVTGTIGATVVGDDSHSHGDTTVANTITLDNITQITNRSHTSLSDIGTNTHAQIDTHIADTSDPHGATLTQTDITLSGIFKVLENGATPTLYGIFDIADLTTADKTYTFPNASGEVTLLGQTIGTAEVEAGVTLDTEWDTEAEVQTAWGAVNILLATEIDTSVELAAILGDETGTGAAVFGTNPTLSIATGSLLLPSSITLPATCSAGQIYMDTDATTGQRIYACESANVWVLQGDGGGGGAGDITDVWGCAAGNCNALTAAAGDSMDATLADSSVPWRANAIAAPTVEGAAIWDSDGDYLAVGDATATKTIYPDSGYYEFTLSPQGAVLDDNNPPAITIIESTGVGTPRFYVADFDAATDEIIYYSLTIPSDLRSGNWLIDVFWITAGIANSCVWEAAISALTEADVTAVTARAAATSNTATEAANATANRLISTTITLSNLDGVAAGDSVVLRFNRDANNISDDLASDARLLKIRLRIPKG